MKRFLLAAVASLVLAVCTAGSSQAALMVNLHSSNDVITFMSSSVVANTITTTETWSGPGIGVIEIVLEALDTGDPFTLVRNITIEGDAWSEFVNELLDPAGQVNDGSDLFPQPAEIPAGFTTSNDSDGIGFDLAAATPDSGGAFAGAVLTTGTRDILTFSGGSGASGTIQITYAFIDVRGPFLPDDAFAPDSNDSLLISSEAVVLPEAGAMFWLAMMLVGAAFARRG